MTGKKFDDGKLRYDLIPPIVLEQLAAVLTKGAAKYGENNWQQVPNANNRYYAAAMRHLQSHMSGDMVDDETGLPHITHALACVAFMTWGVVTQAPDEEPEPDFVAVRRDYYKALYDHSRQLHDFLLRTGNLGRFMDAVINTYSYNTWLAVLQNPAHNSLLIIMTDCDAPEGTAYWQIRDLEFGKGL